jgi:ATP-binding cassette subfamily B protein
MKELFTLNRFFVKYWKRLILGVFFVVAANLFGIIPARLIRQAIDSVAAYQSENNTISLTMQEELSKSLIKFAALLVFFTVLRGIFMFFMRQTLIVMSRLIEADQKNEIFDHYQKLGNRFYHSMSTGDIVNRISEDVSRVRMFTGPAIMYTVNLLVMFIMVIAAMIQINPRLALLVCLPLPLLSILIYLVHETIHRKSEKVQSRLSQIATLAQEYFSGIRILKSFTGEKQAIQTMDLAAEEYKMQYSELNRVNALFMPLLFLLIGMSTLLAVYGGGRAVLDGKATLGNIAEFVVYVNMLTWPVASLGWVVTLIQRAAASQKRINEFLKFKPDIISGHQPLHHFKGQICFRQVSYTYPQAETEALSEVDFMIHPGKTTGIIGRTGSGKSTLVSLLMRLADPDKGEILIDGKNLKDIDLHQFRSLTGYVPQDAFLFSDTIFENIRFGNAAADLHAVIEAARLAGIHHEIENMSKGYETRIGERGITLSGGQKQRIAIARAFIRNPRLLILDDCLSAVDANTEKLILSNIKKISTGITTLIISHKISSIEHADEILVMAHGKIAERGNHRSLISSNGIYAGICRLQQLEASAVNGHEKFRSSV